MFAFVLFCFVLLRFHLYAFVEAAALPSIVLRHAGTPIATRVSFFLSFSEYIFYISLYGRVPTSACVIIQSKSINTHTLFEDIHI